MAVQWITFKACDLKIGAAAGTSEAMVIAGKVRAITGTSGEKLVDPMAVLGVRAEENARAAEAETVNYRLEKSLKKKGSS